MDPKLIDKLRKKQALRMLPDGREAVDITVQYTGDMPALPRAERRSWLRDHFDAVREQVKSCHLVLDPESLSVSAQTVQAVVPVSELDRVEQELADGRHRIDLDYSRQLTDE
jgi:hypothetical protein